MKCMGMKWMIPFPTTNVVECLYTESISSNSTTFVVGVATGYRYHGFHHMAIHIEVCWACSMYRITATSSGSMAISTERLAVKILKGLNMNSHVWNAWEWNGWYHRQPRMWLNDCTPCLSHQIQPHSWLGSQQVTVTTGFTTWLFILKPVGLVLCTALRLLRHAQWLILSYVWR